MEKYNKRIGFLSYKFALQSIMDTKILLCLIPCVHIYKQYLSFCEGIAEPLTYQEWESYMCNVFNLKTQIDYDNNNVYFIFL